MCCSRKNQAAACGGRGRTMRRTSSSTGAPSTLSPSSSKSSISPIDPKDPKSTAPPSYEAAISQSPIQVHRNLPLDPHIMAQLNECREDLSDDEEFFEMSPRGTRKPSAELTSATEAFVSKWKSRREEKAAQREEWRLKKEDRKAEKAARKAEKYRERAEKWSEKAAGREGRYVY